jgi:hypothetical protein
MIVGDADEHEHPLGAQPPTSESTEGRDAGPMAIADREEQLVAAIKDMFDASGIGDDEWAWYRDVMTWDYTAEAT